MLKCQDRNWSEKEVYKMREYYLWKLEFFNKRNRSHSAGQKKKQGLGPGLNCLHPLTTTDFNIRWSLGVVCHWVNGLLHLMHPLSCMSTTMYSSNTLCWKFQGIFHPCLLVFLCYSKSSIGCDGRCVVMNCVIKYVT